MYRNDLLREGERAILSNQNQRAVELMDQLLQRDSNDLNALYMKAQALSNMGKFDDSLIEYDRLLSLVPDDPIWQANANISKSDALIELDKLDEAEDCLDMALGIKPRLARGWIHKARIEARRENYGKSLEFCDRAVSVDPTDPRGWNNRAFALYQLGKYKECIKSAKKALLIKPDYAMVYLHMGRAYMKLGKTNKSRKCEEKFESIVRKGQMPEHTRGHKP